MERPNQSPKPECCREVGQSDASSEKGRKTNEPPEAYTGNLMGRKRDSHTAKAIEPRDNYPQVETHSTLRESNTDRTVQGEGRKDLPGSKSMARQEGASRNLGDPSIARRTNCESQAGKEGQRQEGPPGQEMGVGSVHSRNLPEQRCGRQTEGTDLTTEPPQETGAVRTTEQHWRTSLRAITNKATNEPKHRFGGLYRMLDEASLKECFYRLRKEAAPGVDGVTFQEYEKNLDDNIRGLVQRLKAKSYRARLVRRKYIPKSPGKFRPLGIPTLEDKLLQCAVAEILQAIYEADFLECSYGYRLGRGPKGAIKALTEALQQGRYEFIVEADIKGFYDHIQHEKLIEMLGQRIQDGAMLQLISKWLKAGILEEDGRVLHPQTGTPQGGIVSPVLANVYLHHVLDLWFEQEVKKNNRGASRLFRYADDFVCAFGYRHEAEAFAQALVKRLREYGLEVAPEKTGNMRFGRGGGRYNGRFDFLGIEFSWGTSRKGNRIIKRRTARTKLRASMRRYTEWIRKQRNQKLSKLMKTLRQKLTGYWNYYGLVGNYESLQHFWGHVCRTTHKWLNRRSQRRGLTWKAFNRLVQRFQIPRPKIVEKSWEELKKLRAELMRLQDAPTGFRKGSLLYEYLGSD
jgi:RNA-directed DNA polymerase